MDKPSVTQIYDPSNYNSNVVDRSLDTSSYQSLDQSSEQSVGQPLGQSLGQSMHLETVASNIYHTPTMNDTNAHDMTQFSTLSSLPSSQMYESTILNETMDRNRSMDKNINHNSNKDHNIDMNLDKKIDKNTKGKGDINPSFHSLQCEIQLWQEAYQSAQESHANRIKQLIREQKDREDEIRKEVKLKWDLKFEELNKDVQYVDRELKWMIQALLGRLSVQSHSRNNNQETINSSISMNDNEDRNFESSKLNNDSSESSFTKNLNDILRNLIQGLEMQQKSTTSTTSSTSHLFHDFKSRFCSVLKYIQQQYEQMEIQNSRIIEENQNSERKIQKLESEMKTLSTQADNDRNDLLQLKQDKARLELELAKEKQLYKHLELETETLKKDFQAMKEEFHSYQNEMKKKLKDLQDEKKEFEIEAQSLKLQLNNKSGTFEMMEARTQELYSKLKKEQDTVEELQEQIDQLTRDLNHLKGVESRLEEVSRQYNKETENRISGEKIIEELNQESQKMKTHHAQLVLQLQNELNDWKRQATEIQLQLNHVKESANSTETFLEQQLKDLEQKYKAEASHFEKKVSYLQRENEEIKVTSEERIANEYQKNISRLVGVISAFNKNIKENEDPVAQISSIFDQYEKRILDIQDKSFSLEAGFKSQALAYENKITELEYKLHSKQSQMDDLKHDIEVAIAKMEEKVSNNAKIRGEERQRYKTVISVLQKQLENSGLSQATVKSVKNVKNATDVNAKSIDEFERRILKYKKVISKIQKEKEALELEVEKSKNAESVSSQRVTLLQNQNDETKLQISQLIEEKTNLENLLKIAKEKEASAEEQLHTIQDLLQQDGELRHQLVNLQQNAAISTTPNNAQKENSQISTEENSALQAQLHEVIQKYRHIKDKYIRQSLRQNELQNYILNLHRSGRISMDFMVGNEKGPMTPSTMMSSPNYNDYEVHRNTTEHTTSTVSTSPGNHVDETITIESDDSPDINRTKTIKRKKAPINTSNVSQSKKMSVQFTEHGKISKHVKVHKPKSIPSPNTRPASAQRRSMGTTNLGNMNRSKPSPVPQNRALPQNRSSSTTRVRPSSARIRV